METGHAAGPQLFAELCGFLDTDRTHCGRAVGFGGAQLQASSFGELGTLRFDIRSMELTLVAGMMPGTIGLCTPSLRTDSTRSK